jgi:hypothetical protein
VAVWTRARGVRDREASYFFVKRGIGGDSRAFQPDEGATIMKRTFVLVPVFAALLAGCPDDKPAAGDGGAAQPSATASAATTPTTTADAGAAPAADAGAQPAATDAGADASKPSDAGAAHDAAKAADAAKPKGT